MLIKNITGGMAALSLTVLHATQSSPSPCVVHALVLQSSPSPCVVHALILQSSPSPCLVHALILQSSPSSWCVVDHSCAYITEQPLPPVCCSCTHIAEQPLPPVCCSCTHIAEQQCLKYIIFNTALCHRPQLNGNHPHS